MNQKFYGKYKATVFSNSDNKGRLQLIIPGFFGNIPKLAEPCVPLAGPTGPSMGVYMVPPIGTGVWVEFEQGDPQKPIWVGCRWGGDSDVPAAANQGLPSSPNIVIQSFLQHNIVISDLPGPTGGITLSSANGATIKVNDTGITIDNGKGAKIEMIGTMIDMNNGALKILN